MHLLENEIREAPIDTVDGMGDGAAMRGGTLIRESTNAKEQMECHSRHSMVGAGSGFLRLP